MDKLKTLLKQIYGLEDTAEKKLEWKKIAYGMAGSNFEIIINGQTKYFFKIVPLTKQEINKNLKVSALMQMNNIEVTMPLPSLKGNLYELDDEGKVCLLYNFIKGVRFLEVDISKKEKAIKTIAKNLARLHIAGSNILDSRIPKIKESRVLQNFKINKLKRKELISEFKNDSKKILDKINTDSMEDIIHDKNKQILAMKEYFIDNNIYKLTQKDINSNQAILHGDYHEDNIIFDDQGELVKIIDWDNCIKFNIGWEIFYTIYSCCYQKDFTNIDNNLDLLFIRSYREVNPISAKDLEIGYKLWLNFNILSLWFLESYYVKNAYRCPNYILTNFNNLTFLMNNQDIFQERFAKYFYQDSI